MPVFAEKTSSTCQSNIWMQARLEKFRSRGEALSVVPFGERTLARIESGEKIPTPDEALFMAEAYQATGLVLRYCSESCPIGSKYRCKVEGKDFSSAVLSFIKERRDMNKMEDRLLDIGCDGKVNNDEADDFVEIMQEIDEIIQAATELKYWALSEYIKEKPAQVAEERVMYKNKAATAAK